MMGNMRTGLVGVAVLVCATLALPWQLSAVGPGSGAFAGDGGPATEARLNNPRGLAVDRDGNLYIADSSNDRVRRVDRKTGMIATVAGSGERGFAGDGGAAGAAQFYFPHGLALDESGNLYVADAGNHRVRRIEADSRRVSTVAGTGNNQFYGDGGPASEAGLSAPRGVALDGKGNLYVSDTQHGCIRKVDREGRISTVAGADPRLVDKGAAPKYLWHPVGLTVGPDGQIYWADATLNRVKRADLGRTDPKTKSGWITIVAGSETMGFSGDGGLARDAELEAPAAVAFDSKGNLYIADHNNQRIRRVDAKTGVITTVAGNGRRGFSGDGKLAAEASLNAPAGLAFDAHDNLYIADAGNHRIRMVEADTGIITTVTGSGPIDEGPPKGPAEQFFL
jgi:DNA-binding beta-propeller fold protein YncE